MNTSNFSIDLQSNCDQNKQTLNESEVKAGLDFILKHFKGRIFPRTIMTKKLGYQREIFDKESILREYYASNYQDCRINAYSSFTNYKEINRTPPTFIMIDLDLDLDRDNSLNKLDKVLKRTLYKIHNFIDGYPSVLWTGNGYHIYQPLDGFILEEYDVFTPFIDNKDLTSKFMQFTERFFTGDRNDSNHNPTIKSCLLRIPGTINSKLSNEKNNIVKIVQEWDGYTPPINYILREFRRYLIQEKINNSKIFRTKVKINNYYTVTWIEKLLQTPIEDGRKYALWRILCPYLVNVKKLDYEQSYKILKTWLEKCNRLIELSFNADREIKNKLRHVKNYNPVSIKTLENDNKDLYLLLKKKVF